MNFTAQELHQYIQLTLKEWDLTDVKVTWSKMQKTLGWAAPWNKEIRLSHRVLHSFPLFKHVFLHELAHMLDYKERGTFMKNGRNCHHGRDFKRWCRTLGISTKTKTDLSLFGLTPSYKKH